MKRRILKRFKSNLLEMSTPVRKIQRGIGQKDSKRPFSTRERNAFLVSQCFFKVSCYANSRI